MFNVNTLTLFVLSIHFIAFILAHSTVIIVNRFIVFIFAPFSLGKVLNSTSYGLEIHKCNWENLLKSEFFFYSVLWIHSMYKPMSLNLMGRGLIYRPTVLLYYGFGRPIHGGRVGRAYECLNPKYFLTFWTFWKDSLDTPMSNLQLVTPSNP